MVVTKQHFDVVPNTWSGWESLVFSSSYFNLLLVEGPKRGLRGNGLRGGVMISLRSKQRKSQKEREERGEGSEGRGREGRRKERRGERRGERKESVAKIILFLSLILVGVRPRIKQKGAPPNQLHIRVGILYCITESVVRGARKLLNPAWFAFLFLLPSSTL